MENSGYRFLLAILIALGLLVAVLPTPFHATKYSIFLYPLVLLLSSAALEFIALRASRSRLARGGVFLIFSVAFVTLSDDHGWYHLWNVDRKEVNFRQIYEQPLQYHYWYRMDYLTPARVVNQNLCDDDLVVLIHSVPSTYYLRRSDYLYVTGPHDVWTNAKSLDTPQELFSLLNQSKKTVWLIMRTENYPYQLDIEADLGRRYVDYQYYRSLDGRIDVFRISHGANVAEVNSGARRICETTTEFEN